MPTEAEIKRFIDEDILDVDDSGALIVAEVTE